MTASDRSRPQRVSFVGIAQPEGAARDRGDRLTAGALIRLAGALDTTVSERVRQIPVRGSSALHPVLDHLREDECLALLADGGHGRVAFDLAGRLSVMPVAFTLHDRRLVFRVGATTAIARYGEGPVAFEVEQLDEAAREGWSVLISGRCSLQDWVAWRPVQDPGEGEQQEVLVVVEPAHVSGRRIRTW